MTERLIEAHGADKIINRIKDPGIREAVNSVLGRRDEILAEPFLDKELEESVKKILPQLLVGREVKTTDVMPEGLQAEADAEAERRGMTSKPLIQGAALTRVCL
jgi:hypothetical protein